MRIAFYAPMKWPGHAVPSGDRLLARMFVTALTRAGHAVAIAARLRSWDGRGDLVRQQRLDALGARLAERLLRRYRRGLAAPPELWFTYHVYHKAPDAIGPRVARALAIPYVVAEASVARKQRDGPWAHGYAVAAAAIAAADAVVCVNPADVPGVAQLRAATSPPERLAPFLDVAGLLAEARAAATAAQAFAPPCGPVRLVTVAMMRPGFKLASYRLLADALRRVEAPDWHLTVVGDGAARPDVEAAFAGLSARVRLAGRLDRGTVAALLQRMDLFVWPAIDEPVGMALLEAQACGVPLVAGRGPGVASIVADGVTARLVPVGDAEAFARAVIALAADPGLRLRMSAAAAAHARATHDLPAAATALAAILERVRGARGTG